MLETLEASVRLMHEELEVLIREVAGGQRKLVGTLSIRSTGPHLTEIVSKTPGPAGMQNPYFFFFTFSLSSIILWLSGARDHEPAPVADQLSALPPV